MSASCYLCATGHSATIPNTAAGDAVGVCQVCGVLACQGHGIRDANYPRWICVICDPSLLAVAALLQSDSKSAQQALTGVPEALIPAARTIRSAREYFDARSNDSWWWVVDDARSIAEALPMDDRTLGPLLSSLSPDGRLLLSCALAIADRLKLEDEELIPLLRQLRSGTRAYA